ncbi:RNA polymerase subunit sigma-24 [bacterium]|nr:RNA polymerase subunit sigma-24 [bacterium]|tara:strand:+ start:9908 stop:10426 length:519 start_codon:yes stop_codon:yes gene_type:complete
MDEHDAIEKCQKGELEHFSVLYEEYFQKIYNFLYYRTFHKETAEDITSKTFIKALEKIGTFEEGKGTFSAWIYRIARNTLFDHWRVSKETVDIEEVWEIGESDKVEEGLDLKEDIGKAQKYLKKLPKDQRDVVLMRVWDELSYKEIADITGKSEGACKVMFSRVINKLRKEI